MGRNRWTAAVIGVVCVLFAALRHARSPKPHTGNSRMKTAHRKVIKRKTLIRRTLAKLSRDTFGGNLPPKLRRKFRAANLWLRHHRAE
jgi:hypothetical protein